jgi:hypothetical protein
MDNDNDASAMAAKVLDQPRLIINPELLEWGDAEGKNRWKAPVFNGTCPNCHRRQTFTATSWRPFSNNNTLARAICGARDCGFVGDAWLTDAARLGQQYAQERAAGARSPVQVIEPTGRDTAAQELPVGVFDAEGRVGVFEPEGVAPFDPGQGPVAEPGVETLIPVEGTVTSSHEHHVDVIPGDDVAWAHRHLDIMAGRDVVLYNADGSPRAIGILGQIERNDCADPWDPDEAWSYKVNISEAERGHLQLWCRGIDQLRPGRDPFPPAA